VIQIDMPMPDSCYECRFETRRGFCTAMPDTFCEYTNDEGRPEWCPLKEQESVKVLHLRKVKAIKHEEILFEDACGYCCSFIMKHWKACPVCGKAVKWK